MSVKQLGVLVVSILKEGTFMAEAVRNQGLTVVGVGPNGGQGAPFSPPPTTLVERFLLVTSIILVPMQNYYPALAGASIMFLVYGVLAAYILVNRQRSLGEVWCHPVFIAAYAFIGVVTLLEFSSPLSGYEEIIRAAQMIGGAVCVAALCRDRASLAACLYGYIATSLWVSVVLFATGYDALQGMKADDFSEATHAREQAFENKPIQGANINQLAFVCSQGGLVAFALSLSNRFKHLRIPLMGIAGFCLTGAFLAMSRGTVVNSLVSIAIILYAHGFKHGKALILVSVLGMGVYAVVPDAVWSRMSYSTDRKNDKMEARASLYDAAINRLPEYIVTGIGAGNFHKKWGFEKGFARHLSIGLTAQPAHNAPLQLTINWGILGLGMFLLIVWCVYRSVPLHCGRDALSLAMLGIMVSVGLLLLYTHCFWSKDFSFALGLLVGSRRWIWPTGVASAIEVSQGPSPYSAGPVLTKQ